MMTLSQQLNQQDAQLAQKERELQAQITTRQQDALAPEQQLAQIRTQRDTLHQRRQEAVLQEASERNGGLVQANRTAVQDLLAALDAALPVINALREKATAVHATFDSQQNASIDAIHTFLRELPGKLEAQYLERSTSDSRYANVQFRHAQISDDTRQAASRAYEYFRENGVDAVPVIVEWISQAETPDEGWMRFGLFYALFGYMPGAYKGDTAEKLTESEINRRRNGGR